MNSLPIHRVQSRGPLGAFMCARSAAWWLP